MSYSTVGPASSPPPPGRHLSWYGTATSSALRVFLGLLAIDAVLELAFISSTVDFLNNRAGKSTFGFEANGSHYRISGLPHNLSADQGHTSNAAAGTALVVVCLGGLVALALRDRAWHRTGRAAKLSYAFYYLWLGLAIPALLLTTGALIYVFTITNARSGERINIASAIELNGKIYTPGAWTPQGWFSAMLRLQLTKHSIREEIAWRYAVMKGWQYNLIPLFVIQLIETPLVFIDYTRWNRKPRQPPPSVYPSYTY